MQLVEFEYLDRIRETLLDLAPELTLCVVIVAVVLCTLFRSDPQASGTPHRTSHPAPRTPQYITLAGIVIHLLLVLYASQMFVGQLNVVDMLSIDPWSSCFKVMTSIAALLTILMSGKQRLEYYVLVIAILLGADLLMMSTHFIMILLSIELMSISSYVLVAGTDPDKARAEAAWKFFIFGSAATAVMTFGLSYLFGASGTAGLPGHFTGADPVMVSIGCLMTLAGLLFKMTAAPFHLWAPDVYQATPSPVVAYLSVVPKFAGLVVITRFLYHLPVQPADWSNVIAGFAILSIVIGTLAALAQRDAKRMMAYSTVAQTGFLLTGVASVMFTSTDASYAIAFYALVFLVMNYAVFMVIQAKEEAGGSVLFKDFSGMGYSAVIPAVTITIAFVSLVGLPPLAGFTAKLLIFTTLWAKFAASRGFIFVVLFVIGLGATVVSLFFYLKIPFYMFFRRAEEKEPLKIRRSTNLLLLFLVGILFALFLFPSVFDWLGGWVIKRNFGL